METIVFLIIVGILSSIFGKGKRKPNLGRTTKPFSVNRFEDFVTMVDKQDSKQLKNAEKISTGKPVATEITPIPTQQEKVTGKSQKEIKRIHKNEVETTGEKLESPDEKTLINGIIWSEILGPPRAKKPYTSKKL